MEDCHNSDTIYDLTARKVGFLQIFHQDLTYQTDCILILELSFKPFWKISREINEIIVYVVVRRSKSIS